MWILLCSLDSFPAVSISLEVNNSWDFAMLKYRELAQSGTSSFVWESYQDDEYLGLYLGACLKAHVARNNRYVFLARILAFCRIAYTCLVSVSVTNEPTNTISGSINKSVE